MADDPISQLPLGGGITGSEQIPASWFNPNPGGGWNTYRYPVSAIAQYAQAGGLVIQAPGNTGEVLAGQTGDQPIWIPAGQTGQFLTANSGGQPTWSNIIPGQGVTSFSFGASGLTPSTPTNSDIVMGGVLSLAYGGTGTATFLANSLVYSNGSSLQATPAWAAGDLFIIDGSGNPNWLGPGTAGQFLTSGGANTPPLWTNIGSGVSSISLGSTGLTPNSPASGAVVIAGTLNTASGGTGLTSFNSGGAVYATSSSALATGTLPTTAGGTGTTTATGSGSNVLATSPTITTPTINNGTLNNPTINNPVGLTLPNLNGGCLAGTRNRIINGGFFLDQYNAGATKTFTAGAGGVYCVDRWYAYCLGANATGHRISSTGPAGSPEQNAYQLIGAVGVTKLALGQRIASRDCFDLAGGSITISFDVSCSTLTSVTVTLSYATSVDTFASTTPIGTSVITGISGALSRVSATIAVPSAATTGLQVEFSVGATTGTFVISNVQVESGTTATPFERRLNMLEGLLCRQRFETSYAGDFALGAVTQMGSEYFYLSLSGQSTISAGSSIRYLPKAATPTIVVYSVNTGAAGKVYDVTSNIDVTVSVANAGKQSFQWAATTANHILQFAFHWAAGCEL